MSGEGKYGRLPKPKDRSKGVNVTMGDVSLQPTHDKAGEWEEEGETFHEHAKPKPEESMVARVMRTVSGAAGAAAKPWASLVGDDKEEE